MTTGPSDQELAKKYWKNQYVSLRHKLEESNPDMTGPSASSRGMPWRAVQEAATAGASTRAFMAALEGGNETGLKQKVSTSDIASAKASIIRSLVAAGRDTAYIEDAMARISPHLDIFALSNDPAVQSILLQRIMNGGSSQSLGLRDLVEAMRVVNDVRGPQQQVDAGSLMTATTQAIRTGAELASSKNNSSLDPLAILQQSHQQALEMQQQHFAELRELQSQQPGLVDSLKDVKEAAETLGWKKVEEPPEISLRKLDIEDRRAEREHTARIESAKSAASEKMWSGLAGSLGKILEVPIVREVGRKAAESFPGFNKAVGAVGTVQSAAARSALDQSVPWGFQCPRCKTNHSFSRQQIDTIEASPTKTWACPSCGEGYVLQVPGAPQSRPQPPEPAYRGPGF